MPCSSNSPPWWLVKLWFLISVQFGLIFPAFHVVVEISFFSMTFLQNESEIKTWAFPFQLLVFVLMPICSVVVMCKPPGKELPDVPPPITMLPPPPIPPATPAVDELIQQSTWNLQQQEQHLSTLRQACWPHRSITDSLQTRLCFFFFFLDQCVINV